MADLGERRVANDMSAPTGVSEVEWELIRDYVQTDDYWQLMHYYAKTGDTARLRRALEEGADPNRIKPSVSNYSALHMAAMNSHPEAVIALLEAGANVDIRNGHNGGTPLALAVLHVAPDRILALGDQALDRRKCATFDALIAGGADVDAAGGVLAIQRIIESACIYSRPIILALFRAGATVAVTELNRPDEDSLFIPIGYSQYVLSAWDLVDAIKKAGAFDEHARRQLNVHISMLTKCFGAALPVDAWSHVAGFYAPRGGY